MSIDTPFNYQPLPYNIIDKQDFSNRQGVKPSYQYKKKRVIWLNTNNASSAVNNGNTFFEFSFNIPQFTLYNQTKLSVISFTSNEDNAKPLIIRIKNLLYDTSSNWCNDNESYPIIFINHLKVVGTLINDKISLTLVPQAINNITIKIDSSFITRNSGFTINADTKVGHFILGLLLEDDDLIMDNIVSPYK